MLVRLKMMMRTYTRIMIFPNMISRLVVVEQRPMHLVVQVIHFLIQLLCFKQNIIAHKRKSLLQLIRTTQKSSLDSYYFNEFIAGDTSFIMASKRQLARYFFEPPRIPSNFLSRHIPVHPNISQMPLNIKQFSERMNHLQRAKFLGEVIFFFVKSLTSFDMSF